MYRHWQMDLLACYLAIRENGNRRMVMTWINSSTTSNADALRASQNSSNKQGVQVDGNTISWPVDGWYEVQSATSYNTMSEGGRSATLPAGSYNVINHTTGERFENVSVGPSFETKNGLNLNPDTDILHPGGFDIPFNHVGPGETIPGINEPAEGLRDVISSAVFDGLNARPTQTIPAETTVTSTVYSAGTKNETHVNTTHTPDTSAATSNQPYTHEIQVYSNQGLIATETYVTSPTGMRIGPAGTNGVEPEKPAPAPETPKPSTTSRNQNTENDTDSRGSSRGANAGTGNETSENPHTR